MPRLRATNSCHLSGLTLVELMVSLALLSMLVVALAGVFGQVSRAWIGSQAETERRQNDRALVDYIATELRSAVVPVERSSTTGKADLQFLINPTSLVSDDYANADTIFWQAPIATESSYGELAEVGYFVKWDAKRASLHRLFINPSIPNAGGTGAAVVANNQFLIYKNPRWLSDTLIEAVAPASPPAYRGLFAENVIGFWVRAFQPDGTELLNGDKNQFDSRVGYKFTNPNNTVEDRFLPAKVEVSMAQLDSKSAVHLDQTWEAVRALSRKSNIHDAADFLEAFRNAARTNRALVPLLPGLRIYSTDVHLENAR